MTPEQYERDRDRAHCPDDSEMLADLDAYGHMTWTVGYGEDEEHDGDWLACFDFAVYAHPERGVLVAYHTVVNSDSGGFIDTLETRVVPAEQAPFNLPDYWAGIGQSHGGWTEADYQDAHRVNDDWNAALRAALEATKEQSP
jgi:hypothetical protein